MACYLAPEKPWLPSATSEEYFHRLNYQTALPRANPDKQHTRFGPDYERELCFCLAKHAEANSDDRLCIIADECQWASIVQEGLFLTKPVQFIDCQSSAGLSLLARIRSRPSLSSQMPFKPGYPLIHSNRFFSSSVSIESMRRSL